MTARNHHFLPQGYLKGFAIDPTSARPQVHVFDLERSSTFVTNIRNVAAERDFNRIDAPDVAPDELEKRLASVESDIALAIERIDQSRSITDDADRDLVCNLIGLIYMRNPRIRANMGDTMERVVRLTGKMMVESKERYESLDRPGKAKAKIPYEEMKEFIDKGEYGIAIKREFQIGLELQTLDKIIPIIAARKWTLLRAGSGNGFITCDYPCCLMWNDEKLARGFYPPGLGLAKTSLIFPLTKSLCMVGTIEGPAEVHDLNDRGLAVANAAIIASADRQVYAPADSFDYLDQDGQSMKKAIDLLAAPSRPGFTRRAR